MPMLGCPVNAVDRGEGRQIRIEEPSFSSSFFQDSRDGPPAVDIRRQLSQFYITGLSKYLKTTPAMDMVEKVIAEQLDQCQFPLETLENDRLFSCKTPEEKLAVGHVLACGGPQVYVPVHSQMLKIFGPSAISISSPSPPI